MFRVLVTEKIAQSGIELLENSGYEVDIQLDLSEAELIKAIEIGSASIHINHMKNPPKIDPKLLPLPPTITITQIIKVNLKG